MTPTAFATFSVCLQYLSPGNAPAWDAGCARFYFATLADVPDADVPALMKAVGSEFTFRPAPQQVLELWRKANTTDGPTAESIAADVYRLIRGGANQRKSREYPCLYVSGPPADAPAEALAVVAAMGGWDSLMADDSPSGVLRGQILKLAAAVAGGEGDAAIDRLRLEYREARAALPPPAAGLESGLEPDAPAPRPSAGGGQLTRLDLRQIAGRK